MACAIGRLAQKARKRKEDERRFILAGLKSRPSFYGLLVAYDGETGSSPSEAEAAHFLRGFPARMKPCPDERQRRRGWRGWAVLEGDEGSRKRRREW